MNTPRLQIAFPEVALIRKGSKKKPGKSHDGRDIEVVGDDLKNLLRVEFCPGVDEKIVAAFFDCYKTFTPDRIRAMVPFRSVWKAFTSFNEAYNAGRRIAQADDEHYLMLRINGEYEVRNGEPFRPYHPGDLIRYERNGQSFALKLKPTNRLRLFLPEVGHLVNFTLKTTSFYDRENIKQQIGAIQAIADALNGGNAAGIPFYVYRFEREVTWNRPGGSALRVKKWLIHIEADPDWVQAAIARMSNFAFTGQAFSGPVKPLELTTDPEAEDDEEDETGEAQAVGEMQPAAAPTGGDNGSRTPTPPPTAAPTSATARPAASSPSPIPEKLIYKDGEPVTMANPAEVEAYRTYTAAHRDAPASREALRGWVSEHKNGGAH